MDDVGAEQLEHPPQNDRRRHPVDVVVAVDRDPLPRRDGALQAVDGEREIGEQERIVEVVEPGISGSVRPRRGW